jgi:xylan 1,4-beta-xylosidase
VGRDDQCLCPHLIERYGLDEVAPGSSKYGTSPTSISGLAIRSKPPTSSSTTTPRAPSKPSRPPAGRRPVHRAGRMGRAVPRPHQAEDVPVDFVSTHVYANDTATMSSAPTKTYSPRHDGLARRAEGARRDRCTRPTPTIPLIFSEYNASYANEPNVTDSTYMGPWLANNIRLCDGLTQSMAYWAFSDVFEEQGVVRTPFYGGFGLVAADHIPKPYAQHLRACTSSETAASPSDSESALVTETAERRASPSRCGTTLRPPARAQPTPCPPAPRARKPSTSSSRTSPNAAVEVWRVDDDHGNVLKAFDAMGRPPGDLTQEQVAKASRRRRDGAARASAPRPWHDCSSPSRRMAWPFVVIAK